MRFNKITRHNYHKNWLVISDSFVGIDKFSSRNGCISYKYGIILQLQFKMICKFSD